jgi:hypothetical protein
MHNVGKKHTLAPKKAPNFGHEDTTEIDHNDSDQENISPGIREEKRRRLLPHLNGN